MKYTRAGLTIGSAVLVSFVVAWYIFQFVNVVVTGVPI